MNNWELYALNKARKGGSAPTPTSSADVRFIDYDGTVLFSYTPEQFAELSAMPANPTHEGLTAQGWNYTLADAQSYVADYGTLDIGQMYAATETQSDGKTRIYIHLEDGRLSPTLGIGLNGTCDIDWGDGTEHSTITGISLSKLATSAHTYSVAGNYIIALDVVGEFAFIGNSTNGVRLLTKTGTADNNAKVYGCAILKLEIGSNITSIGNNAFQNCYSLTSVTIPNSVTSIGKSAFYNCCSLTSITIPNSVTSIGSQAFYSCYSLTSITIPNSVTSIGSQAFYSCYSLTSITIPSSVTSIESYTFYNCTSFTSITIPSSVTSIGLGALSNCTSLTSITIPSSVTSIGNQAFSNCFSLTSITIPNSVTSIESNTFYNCYGLGLIKFKSSTPAKVSNVNAWTNIPTDCTIYVPQGSLSAYTSASKYPSSSTYTYVEYEEA